MLRYKQQGSGTNLLHSDIMEFEYRRIYEELKLLNQRWQKEAAAMKG